MHLPLGPDKIIQVALLVCHANLFRPTVSIWYLLEQSYCNATHLPLDIILDLIHLTG